MLAGEMPSFSKDMYDENIILPVNQVSLADFIHTGCISFGWDIYDACATQNSCKLENAIRNSVRLVCVCNNVINIFKMV